MGNPGGRRHWARRHPSRSGAPCGGSPEVCLTHLPFTLQLLMRLSPHSVAGSGNCPQASREAGLRGSLSPGNQCDRDWWPSEFLPEDSPVEVWSSRGVVFGWCLSSVCTAVMLCMDSGKGGKAGEMICHLHPLVPQQTRGGMAMGRVPLQ